MLDLLTYNGWPSKEDWVKLEAWWDKEYAQINETMKRKGEKGFNPKWHFKVKRIADVAVTACKEMQTVAAENFSQWSCEKWAWRTNLIKNALIELNILPWPLPNQDNWFTRINAAPQNILDTKGDLMKMKFQIGKILPLGWNPIGLMDLQIESKDWIPFEKDELSKIMPCKAPKMKNLSDNYRLILDPEPILPAIAAKTPKNRIRKKTTSKKEDGVHAITTRKRKMEAETIVVSETEDKPKKMKQATLSQLKKV